MNLLHLPKQKFDGNNKSQYSHAAAFVTEVMLTIIFLIVILGAPDKHAPAGFAPIAIGLAWTLTYLISIPVANTSVKPARSSGPALEQLWLFWVAPIVGAVIAGVVDPFMTENK